MSEEFDDQMSEVEDKCEELEISVNDLNDRILYIEEQNIFTENYKIFLYPATIKEFIENLIKLQSINDQFEKYYPASLRDVENYFNNFSFNPENIKYKDDIPEGERKIIFKLISDQGWSGFNYLENLENNIDLNKPIVLYYGILQSVAYFSNLHFNFTSHNRRLSQIANIRTHGIDLNEFKNIGFNPSISSILSKKIKLQKTGLASRFTLAYESNLLSYFINETTISLIDLLKNYFWKVEGLGKSELKQEYGRGDPDVYFNSKILSLYLISYTLSMLSRYKIDVWVKLLENKETKISYFIKYFLKFAKSEFLYSIYNRIDKERYSIPQMSRTASVFDI